MGRAGKTGGLADLGQRYRAAFGAAWRGRAEMTPAERVPYERQFLPAALSLEETPVSPAPRLAMRLLLAFAVLTVLWAVFGRMDVVATAPGKIVPDDRSKTIQPFEVATVTRILVRDGQDVEAGEALLELDATRTRADQARLRGELALARLQVARGRALLAVLEQKAEARLTRPEGVTDDQFREAERLFGGQVEEYAARVGQIEAETARRRAELEATRALVDKLEQTLPLARQRAGDFRHLAAQDFVARHRWLAEEQARIELAGDLAGQRHRLKEIEAALGVARSQRRGLSAETRRRAQDSIIDGRQKQAALEQEYVKAESRGRLMRLTSPVAGTVQQLAAHTVGGVVTPAQPLMVIVPRGDRLEVEAFIENKDIGFIRPNQEAEVKVETFPYTKYGAINARVISVSHDAIQDERRGLVYSARVRMAVSKLRVGDAEVNLSPGMAVSVEVKLGTRRVIEYFLSPLMQHAQESLRER